MSKRVTHWGVGLLALLGVGGGPVRAADVHVGINIGVPAPPPVVVQAPPRLVVVPDVPAVRYAPDLGVNFFFYGGRYYTFHEGAWFVTPAYGAPWEYVPAARLPRAVRVVPVRYYRVPPGRAKWRDRRRPGRPRGHEGGDDSHGRHRGHGDRHDD